MLRESSLESFLLVTVERKAMIVCVGVQWQKKGKADVEEGQGGGCWENDKGSWVHAFE